MKPVSVNPLKTSPALGAAYALQGIKGAIPLFHSAPGCTFLGKVLLTQHLREPVGLVGTDIKEMSTIMGGWEELEKRVIEIYEKFKPSLIGIIGTALSEVRGEDINQIISNFQFPISNFKSKILYISAPDYIGGFSEGYNRAVERLIEVLAKSGPVITGQVAALPSSSLTLSDIEEIKDTLIAFGLRPVVLPDISLSMDGSKERFSNIPLDGTTLEEIASIGRSSTVIAIGESMRRAGTTLSSKFNIPLYEIPLPIGLESTDGLVRLLISISGNSPPGRIKRWRKRLIDGMIDSHLITGGCRIAIGLDEDILKSVSGFLREIGIEAMGATEDLEGIEDISRDIDLLISNSHGKETAERLGVPLMRMGFPVYDRFGEPLKLRAGYRGTLSLLSDIANALFHKPPGGELCHLSQVQHSEERSGHRLFSSS